MERHIERIKKSLNDKGAIIIFYIRFQKKLLLTILVYPCWGAASFCKSRNTGNSTAIQLTVRSKEGFTGHEPYSRKIAK
jgi:hypothetical protein